MTPNIADIIRRRQLRHPARAPDVGDRSLDGPHTDRQATLDEEPLDHDGIAAGRSVI